jgi:hypothetical protein
VLFVAGYIVARVTTIAHCPSDIDADGSKERTSALSFGVRWEFSPGKGTQERGTKRHGWKIELGFFLLLGVGVPGRFDSTRLVLALGLWRLRMFRGRNRADALTAPAAAIGAALSIYLILLRQLELSTGYRWAFSCAAATAALLTLFPYFLVSILLGTHCHR